MGAPHLVGRCGRDDAAGARRLAADARRRCGGRRAGCVRLHRLDVARSGPGLSAQPAHGGGGRGDRPPRGVGPGGGAARGAGVADRVRPPGGRRGGGRSGVDGPDWSHPGLLRGRPPAAGRDAGLRLGLDRRPPERRGARAVVGAAGRLPQRVLPAGPQRALHRADRVRRVHHRRGGRLPARRRGRRARPRRRHRRLHAAGRHAAADRARPVDGRGAGRVVPRGPLRGGRGAGRRDARALPPPSGGGRELPEPLPGEGPARAGPDPGVRGGGAFRLQRHGGGDGRRRKPIPGCCSTASSTTGRSRRSPTRRP